MKNAVIFDLDGTLWDSTGEVYKIWNRVFEGLSGVSLRVTRADLAAVMGKTTDEIGRIMFPECSPDEQKRYMDECGKAEAKYLAQTGAYIYPRLHETLTILNEKYDLYIVSNCQCGYLEAFLKAHDTERYFKDIEYYGRTGLYKGQNIRLLMERNGIESAVYVGDTEGDREAAQEAGVLFVWAAYGFGTVKKYNYKIDTFSDLPQILSEHFK